MENVQRLFDKYIKETSVVDALVRQMERRTEGLRAQIEAIQREYEEALGKAAQDVKEARQELERTTLDAYGAELFPEGKKRLPLNGGWVQVSERKTLKVADPSAAARFIIAEGVEDTVIKGITVNKDAASALLMVKGKFPGVEQETVHTVSVKKEE